MLDEPGGAGAAPRILVVAPEPFYEDRGTPIAVRQVLTALVECGYAVELLTFPIGDDPGLAGVEIRRSPRPVPIRRVPIGFSWRKVLLDLGLVAELRRRLRDRSYAAVHAVEEAAFPAVWLGRRLGIPVVYDMQSSLPEQLADRAAFRIPPLPGLLRRCERWLLRNASYVVSSTGLAYRVGTLAPETRHLEWRFPPPPSSATEGDTTSLRAELGIPTEAPVVVYTGNFAPYQGVDLLLEALPAVRRSVPGAVLVLVGGVAREISRGAGRSVPTEAFRVVPRRDRAEVGAYHRMATALVSPRVSGSNLPLKVLDYLAAHRPIVATDIPAHRSVLTAERALLVAPEPEALASGIVRVLRDPELAARLATNGRTYAERNLGWSTFVRAIRQVYGDLCGRPPGADARASYG